MIPQILFCDIDRKDNSRLKVMGPNGFIKEATQDLQNTVKIDGFSYTEISDFGRQISVKIANHYSTNPQQPLRLWVRFHTSFNDASSFEPFYELLEWIQTWMKKYSNLDVYLTSSTGSLKQDTEKYDKYPHKMMMKITLAKLEDGLNKWKDEKSIDGNDERMAHEVKKHFWNEFFIHPSSLFDFKKLFEKIISS